MKTLNEKRNELKHFRLLSMKTEQKEYYKILEIILQKLGHTSLGSFSK